MICAYYVKMKLKSKDPIQIPIPKGLKKSKKELNSKMYIECAKIEV